MINIDVSTNISIYMIINSNSNGQIVYTDRTDTQGGQSRNYTFKYLVLREW